MKVQGVLDGKLNRIGEWIIWLGHLQSGSNQLFWRKCVGIEPTVPGINLGPSDLKSVEATRPQSLPSVRHYNSLAYPK